MARLKNTSSLLTRKLADCMCAIAHQCNSLQNWYFVRLLHFNEGITSAANLGCLVNRWVCLAANITDCMYAIAYQYNSLQKLMFLRLLHFNEGLFSAAKMARLKNTSSLLTRKLADCMCAIAHQCNSLQNWYSLNCCMYRNSAKTISHLTAYEKIMNMVNTTAWIKSF